MTIRFPSPLVDAIPSTPPRGRNSIRLTTHIDMNSEPNGELLIAGAARELRTTPTSTEELTAATITASLDNGRVLREIEATPHDARTSELVGKVVGSGFRSGVREVFRGDPLEEALELLVDDLPAAALISGYASLYSGEMKIAPKHLDAGLLRPNICSGWREEGTMLATLRVKGQFPVPMGPPANVLERSDDPSGWHVIEPLGPGAMRRRRLIDLFEDEEDLFEDEEDEKGDEDDRENTDSHRGGARNNQQPSRDLRIFAMFRDTHVDRDGVESILHEYSLSAYVDPSSSVVSNCVARPRVLPWRECPEAAQSASHLNGLRLDELSSFVAQELRGTTTCTHLNDLLRSLSRVSMLLSRLH